MKFRLQLPSLHRTLILSVGLKVLGTAATFGVSVLLARTLGIEQYGLYAFWLSVLMLLLTPLQTGMAHLIVREGSISQRGGSRAVIELALWGAKWVLVITPLIVIVGVGVLGIVGKKISLSGDLRAFYAGLLLTLFVPLTAIVGSSVRALGGANWGQFPDRNMRPLAFLVLLIATIAFPLVGAGFNATGAMALHSAASMVAFVSALIIFKHHIKSSEDSSSSNFVPRPNPQLLRGAGSLALLAGLQLLNASVGILVLGFLGSDSDVGQFKVAAQLAGLTSFGLAAVNPALHSSFATLIAEGKRGELQKVVSTGVRISFLVAIPPILVLFFAPKLTLSLLFGEQYQLATITLQILLFGQIFNVVLGPVAALLNMGGYQRITIYAMGAAVCINALVSVLLWPTCGAQGVAVGTTAGFFAWNVALWFSVKRNLGVNSAVWSRSLGIERAQ